MGKKFTQADYIRMLQNSAERARVDLGVLLHRLDNGVVISDARMEQLKVHLRMAERAAQMTKCDPANPAPVDAPYPLPDGPVEV